MMTDVRGKMTEFCLHSSIVPRPSSIILLVFTGGIGIKCEIDINNDGKSYDIIKKYNPPLYSYITTEPPAFAREFP